MTKEKREWSLKEVANRATQILLGFDKLPNNPDQDLIRKRVIDQLEQDGYLNLVIFACLDWIPEKLSTNNPENFIAQTTRDEDLFVPRIAKLQQIQDKLYLEGILSKIIIILGDTDLEVYFEKILNEGGIQLNSDMLREREKIYTTNFTDRINKTLRSNTETIVWSKLSNLYSTNIDIPEDLINLETESMRQSYLNGKNFRRLNLKVSDETFKESAKTKITMYANQGKMVDDLLNGIILQTETPWLLRAQMLKLSEDNLPIIYPWIRKEEIANI